METKKECHSFPCAAGKSNKKPTTTWQTVQDSYNIDSNMR